MTIDELVQASEALEAEIHGSCRSLRPSYRPRLTSLMAEMKARRYPVPKRLRRLEEAMTEQIIEDRFDNLPV